MLVYSTDKKIQAGIEDVREGVCGWDHDEVLCMEPAVEALYDWCSYQCGKGSFNPQRCQNGIHMVAPAGYCEAHQRISLIGFFTRIYHI